MAKGDDIQERLIDFAVRVLKVCDHLPASAAGKHVGNQLLRSGTAPAAHYAEARGAESTADFIHKLKICLKELNETQVWLQIASKSNMIAAEKLADLQSECISLAKITNTSITTARASLTPAKSIREEDALPYCTDTTSQPSVINNQQLTIDN